MLMATVSGVRSTDIVMDDTAGLGVLLAVLAASMFLGLICYVVQAMALYKIAENQGYDKPWLAWVPVINSFMLPILVEDDVHEPLQGKFTWIYGISIVVSLIGAFFIPFITFIPTLLMYYAFFAIANRFSERPVVHLLVAIITLGLAIPFQLFRFRNRESLYEY